MKNPKIVSPITVRMIAPGTFLQTNAAATTTPAMTIRGLGWLKAAKPTSVAGLSTMTPPFLRPMKAMKSPIPQVIASLSSWGMASNKR